MHFIYNLLLFQSKKLNVDFLKTFIVISNVISNVIIVHKKLGETIKRKIVLKTDLFCLFHFLCVLFFSKKSVHKLSILLINELHNRSKHTRISTYNKSIRMFAVTVLVCAMRRTANGRHLCLFVR